MAMETPRDLFIHELQDLYDAEHRFLQALKKMSKETEEETVVTAFDEHAVETEGQIRNLEAAFEALGEKAKRAGCLGAQGIVGEHDHFVKEEKPSAEVLTMFNIGAAGKAEHYEIVSYSGLIEMATLMGEDRVTKLLGENLKQEEQTAKKLEKLEQQIARRQIKQMAGAGA